MEDWKGWVAWSISFDTFVAVVARSYPSKFQQLLAIRATILMEALRFGCKGWLSYDKMFRKNIEKYPTANWALLHPMFYSLTFFSQRVEAFTCQQCTAPDHSNVLCPTWTTPRICRGMRNEAVAIGTRNLGDRRLHRENASAVRAHLGHQPLRELRPSQPTVSRLTMFQTPEAL